MSEKEGEDFPESIPAAFFVFPELHDRTEDEARRETAGVGDVVRPDEEPEDEGVYGPADHEALNIPPPGTSLSAEIGDGESDEPEESSGSPGHDDSSVKDV